MSRVAYVHEHASVLFEGTIYLNWGNICSAR